LAPRQSSSTSYSRPVMGFTDHLRHLGSSSPAHVFATAAATRTASGTGGGIGGILKSISSTVTALSHTIGGVFAGVGSAGLVGALSKALLSLHLNL
jgi:hypothetical protein